MNAPYSPPAVLLTLKICDKCSLNFPVTVEDVILKTGKICHYCEDTVTKLEYYHITRVIGAVAAMLADTNIDKFLGIIAEAKKTGPTMEPAIYIKALDRLVHLEKTAKALQAVKQEVTRDMKCVCGHGFLFHLSPGAQCVHVPQANDNRPNACACERFFLDRSEY